MTIWMPPPSESPVRDTTKFVGPRVLIAVKSCVRDWMRGDHECIRKTWGAYVPKNVDLRFFMGNGDGWLLGPGHDEIILNCPDDYFGLPRKVKNIAEWAFVQGYDFAYLCDNDTFIHPVKLLESGFQGYDWSGHFWTFDGKNKYFHGGYGYWLSRKAMSILAGSEVGDAKYEDGWVGDMLYKYQLGIIKVGTLPKFSWHFPKDHYPSPNYIPTFPWQQMMTELHILGKQPKDRTWPVVISGYARQVTYNLIDRMDKS